VEPYLAYADLFAKHASELRQLTRRLRDQFHRLQAAGYGTAFSDVEGELLYLLVRETQPDVVWEISAWQGWSTNYLLAGLTANGKGSLHSFELTADFDGRPAEAVIRGNQHPAWDQQRLTVHIGDARETVPLLTERPGLVLLDSCHEDWFARWYLAQVLPLVSGFVMIQDIAFIDGLENSTEASEVWRWLGENRVGVDLVGRIEEQLAASTLRVGIAERRHRRSNALLFRWPDPVSADPPELSTSASALVMQAGRLLTTAPDEADALLSAAVRRVLDDVMSGARHRVLLDAGDVYLRLGQPAEADRCYQRALAVTLDGAPRDREKALAELIRAFRSRRRPRLLTVAVAAAAIDRGAGLRRRGRGAG
jgi:predicted O-methyltransferase YrrM